MQIVDDVRGAAIVQSPSTGRIFNRNTGATYPPTNSNSNSGSSGGGSYSGGGSSGGGGGSASPSYPDMDSYLNELRAMLEAEKAAKEAKAAEKYKALISQADQNYESARNDISLNNARTNKWLNQQYGGVSGQGLSNRLRAQTNYNNNLSEALADKNTAYQNALVDKYSDLAEATNSYANQYSNFASNLYGAKLSNDTTRYNNMLDLDYRKYIKSLGY